MTEIRILTMAVSRCIRCPLFEINELDNGMFLWMCLKTGSDRTKEMPFPPRGFIFPNCPLPVFDITLTLEEQEGEE